MSGIPLSNNCLHKHVTFRFFDNGIVVARAGFAGVNVEYPILTQVFLGLLGLPIPGGTSNFQAH